MRTRRPAPWDAFEHLVGERLTIDMRDVLIIQVTGERLTGSRQVHLIIRARDRPVRGREYAVRVTCPDDKGPLWVVGRLRKRELHDGCRYELLK